MIRVRFLRSFDDSLAQLSHKQKAKARKSVVCLLDYFSGGSKPVGLGLRQLRKPYWEIRASLSLRVLFLLESDLATFILVGSHDTIRRHLSR